MESDSYSKKYYHANKEKFEEYQMLYAKQKVYCECCCKYYKQNYMQHHLGTDLHKRNEYKKMRERIY